MNITECIPLPGRGLVARRGHLVALTGGTDAGPDPLLTALTAVAYSNGDGAALALAATRAAAERGGRPAWACAGVTLGEFLAVAASWAGVPVIGTASLGAAAVAASQQKLQLTAVIVVAVVAGEVGGLGGYVIGRRWGRRLLERPGRHQAGREKMMQRGERLYARWGWLAVFFTPPSSPAPPECLRTDSPW